METQAETQHSEKQTQLVRIPIGDIVSPIVIRLEPLVDASGVTTLTPHVSIEEPTKVGEETSDTTGKAIPVESQHVGNVGERKVLKLKLLRHKILRSPTTIAYLYEFRDMGGNIVQWLTHKNKGIQEGNEYYLKCTVKKFYKRRGVNITAITRCRFM